VETGAPYEAESRLFDRVSGAYVWHLLRAVPVRDAQGHVRRWLGTCTDIHDKKTEAQRLEAEVLNRTEQLRNSLVEKETLLKEVHHRVKNNLQVISSLLKMQSDLLSNETAVAALKESQQRVLSMALIHERLYGSRQMDAVDFAAYAETLTGELFYSYARPKGHVMRRLKLSRLLLNIDQAIPCGLILNELVTNALKYAFPDDRSGEITIELTQPSANWVRLTVADDGVGLPEGFTWQHSKSLGLPIVEILAKQLGGQLSVQNNGGAVFSVEFPAAAQALSAA
jgi:two-component sensor histidine kinase